MAVPPTRRALLADILLALGLAVAMAAITAKIGADDDSGSRSLDALAYAWIVLTAGALGLRRRFPLSVLAVTTVTVLLYLFGDYPGGPIYVGPVIAMYTVVSLGDDRRGVLAAVGAGLAIVGLGTVSDLSDNTTLTHFLYLGWVAAAVFLGLASRNRRYHLLGLEQRARQLEESREEEARPRVAEERLRIARDLHDVVAHSLASINVQAGAGAHVAEQHPDQAREALLAIKDASGAALTDLRGTLDLLRQADAGPVPLGPVAGLDQLDGLVENMDRSGVSVAVRCDGADGLAPAVDGAAYRIVQESLTNVLRHARASSAAVVIERRNGSLVVDVTDDGIGPAASTGRNDAGHGIAGMRERALALGGELAAGPAPSGGFRVHAELPIEASR
jgi:signal transduction histidine kinase